MSRAERFILDLSDDEEDSPHPTNPPTTHPSKQPTSPSTTSPPPTTPPSFIGDIIERAPSAPKPPTAPIYKQTPTGFPIHKKRTRVSAFKAARGGGVGAGSAPVAGRDGGVAASARGVGGVGGMAGGGGGETVDKEEEERRQIDLENQRKMAAMSQEEIEQERAELLSALDPAVVAMLMKRGAKTAPAPAPAPMVSDAAVVHRMKGDLTKAGGGEGKDGGEDGKREIGLEDYLKRANIDDGRGDTWVEDAPTTTPTTISTSGVAISSAQPSATAAAAAATTAMKVADGKEEKEKVTRISKPTGRRVEPTKAVHWLENDEAEPKELPDLQPASNFTPRSHAHSSTTSTSTTQPTDPSNPTDASTTDPATDPSDTVDTMHFPRPPTLPDLDPSSPNFLTDLHTAYFPSLPSSPSSLAWLAPLPTPGSPADLESSYSPSQTSIPASSLRFDFKGQLLPPRISRAMPTDRGLHHHADAPEAGGYTIGELARLMRSSVPQQRGIAVQVLGRVLYRLGKGEWGMGGEMTMGLWRCVEEGGVVGGLVAMVGDNDGGEGGEGGNEGGARGERHRSVKAYATEAVWLWRMGGGKVMGAI